MTLMKSDEGNDEKKENEGDRSRQGQAWTQM
jgi:hypothetical protein